MPRKRYYHQSDDHQAGRGDSDDWAIYSKVHHRLALLDSPDPDGWTVKELAEEYGCSERWMANVLARLVRDSNALKTKEGRYIGP